MFRIKVAVLFGLLSFASQDTVAQVVPEIADPNLSDIAMMFPTPSGAIIRYNPILCAQAGHYVCAFYRAHEYGHVALGHGFPSQGFVPNWPQALEFQADCWAAQNADPASLMAAFQFFATGGGSTPVHGTGPQRAQRVRACALQVGRWPGP